MKRTNHDAQVTMLLHTNGSGFWTKQSRRVKHSKMTLRVSTMADHTWGELRVFFDPRDWDTSKYGLIYTDNLWERELKEALVKAGFSALEVKSVAYTEQGMQGDDYVSLDVGGLFIHAFVTKYVK